MKKIIAILLVLVLAAGCLAGCSNGGKSGSKQEQVTWRAQSVENSGTNRFMAIEHFAELVKEKTNGNFVIEVYSAGTLYTQEALVDSVNNGVTECAFTSNDYHSGIEPMMKLAAFRSSDLWYDHSLDEKFLAMYEPLVAQAYEAMGLVYVSNVLALPGECFMSNKPINTLKDFNGLLIRSAGFGQELYESLGAGVVTMPMGDVYSAAKLGTIDAFEVAGYSDNKGNALHEVCKYIIEPCPHSTSGINVGNLVVNKDAWAKLPDEYKKVLTDTCAENRQFIFDFLTDADKEAREYFINDCGITACTLSDADFAQLKNNAAKSIHDYYGKSELSNKFIDLYIEFLSNNGYQSVADIVKQ